MHQFLCSNLRQYDCVQPSLSVIVPAHNNPSQLDQCLRALQPCREADIELIVVDDCSTENIRAITQLYAVEYYRLAKRGGPAAARNFGAQHARGEIIIFIDSDVVAAPNVFQIIRAEFQNHPQLAALFGSYDDEPACPAFISTFKNLLHHYTHQHACTEATTFWAGCGAIRKNVFERIGGFAETTFPVSSIEDIELGNRLFRSGYKTLLVKNLQVKHLKKWTLKTLLYSDIAHRAIPWTRLIVRTGSLPADLNLSWASRASSILVGLLLLTGMEWTHSMFESTASFEIICAVVALACMAGLLFLNCNFYGFLFRKRGWAFALLAIPVHWTYLLYSGTVFVACGAVELLRRELDSSAGRRHLPENYHAHPDLLTRPENASDD